MQQRSRNAAMEEKWRLDSLKQLPTQPDTSEEARSAAEKLKRLCDKER